MSEFFTEHPGRLYVVATLLPLLPVVLMLLAGAAKNLARAAAATDGFAAWVYRRLGGDRPQVWGAYLSVVCVAASAALSVVGGYPYIIWDQEATISEAISEGRSFPPFNVVPPQYSEQVEWIHIGAISQPVEDDPQPTALRLGYRIDLLTAVMFLMVTVVSTLIFIFSIGYMDEERETDVQDHEAHSIRSGRFSEFFLYMSLFVASMLNLLIADNLLQIFVSWELVGVCSFFLIAFYRERPNATMAASKAFIVNRIGDAGFLIAIAIAWSVFGTLDVLELSEMRYRPWIWDAVPYFDKLNLLFGLGLFLGCVGKSAQVPLQVWLPDAMAGPTPISALIHAATMVAAGVYLVARCSEMFTPDVLLVIAYTGAATTLLGATAACVQTDIKKVLAYSTCSQLGLMMLALGVGGWVAGVFHLLTHAFFKALLFLAAGSVIYGLHHEQDLRKMGGLRRKMPITAYTMLVGVLAISGFAFLSGWYSKELILTDALRAGLARPAHATVAIIPFLTAGLTAFYMLRLWLLVFAGEPRDPEAFDHARESPWVMTLPLIALAVFSIGVGWGWPIWEVEASHVATLLRVVNPCIVQNTYLDDDWPNWVWASDLVHEYHLLVELATGIIALAGYAVAYVLFTHRFNALASPAGSIATFFARAWYFDALYAAVFRRPTVRLAFAAAAADKRPGAADGAGSDSAAKRLDPGTLDGWLNAVGQGTATAGAFARRLQVGRVRGYVLALGLTVIGLLGMLAASR